MLLPVGSLLIVLGVYWCITGMVLWWSYGITTLVRGGYYQRNQSPLARHEDGTHNHCVDSYDVAPRTATQSKRVAVAIGLESRLWNLPSLARLCSCNPHAATIWTLRRAIGRLRVPANPRTCEFPFLLGGWVAYFSFRCSDYGVRVGHPLCLETRDAQRFQPENWFSVDVTSP
jgi:hypothetical protein